MSLEKPLICQDGSGPVCLPVSRCPDGPDCNAASSGCVPSQWSALSDSCAAGLTLLPMYVRLMLPLLLHRCYVIEVTHSLLPACAVLLQGLSTVQALQRAQALTAAVRSPALRTVTWHTTQRLRLSFIASPTQPCNSASLIDGDLRPFNLYFI